jgi:hypothetical protein
MEGIEHEPDRGMVRASHDLPGITVIVNVPSPGEGLESHAHAALRGSLAELMKIGCGAVDSAEGVRRDVAAHHQEVAAKFLHDVELALGPGEHLGALGIRHTLEVAKRLERDRLQTEAFDYAPDLGRCSIEG